MTQLGTYTYKTIKFTLFFVHQKQYILWVLFYILCMYLHKDKCMQRAWGKLWSKLLKGSNERPLRAFADFQLCYFPRLNGALKLSNKGPDLRRKREARNRSACFKKSSRISSILNFGLLQFEMFEFCIF